MAERRNLIRMQRPGRGINPAVLQPTWRTLPSGVVVPDTFTGTLDEEAAGSEETLTGNFIPWDWSDLGPIRHYDPDDTTPGVVATWLAHSGAGPDLPSFNSPLCVNGVLNGHHVIRLAQASNQYFEAASGGTSLSGSAAWTVIAVYKSVTPSTIGMLFHVGLDAARIAVAPGGIHYCVTDETTQYGTYTTGVDSVWVKAIWRFDGAGLGNSGRLRLRFNGADQTPAYTGTIPATTTVSNTVTNIGRYDGSGPYVWDGDVGLVLLVPYAISDFETDLSDALIFDKYAVLPEGLS